MNPKGQAIIVAATLGLALAMATQLAHAQTAPPHSTVASPQIYRVIAQNNRYRVIAVTWKPGQRDAWHSHPEAAAYFLTFCHLRMHSPDGKSREVSPQKDSAFVNPPVPSHWVENVGKEECRLVMFEPQ